MFVMAASSKGHKSNFFTSSKKLISSPLSGPDPRHNGFSLISCALVGTSPRETCE